MSGFYFVPYCSFGHFWARVRFLEICTRVFEFWPFLSRYPSSTGTNSFAPPEILVNFGPTTNFFTCQQAPPTGTTNRHHQSGIFYQQAPPTFWHHFSAAPLNRHPTGTNKQQPVNIVSCEQPTTTYQEQQRTDTGGQQQHSQRENLAKTLKTKIGQMRRLAQMHGL